MKQNVHRWTVPVNGVALEHLGGNLNAAALHQRQPSGGQDLVTYSDGSTDTLGESSNCGSAGPLFTPQ